MRVLLAALLLVHSAAMGQTFACQYTAAAGLDWQRGRWQIQEFRPLPPFFIKVANRSIDTESLKQLLGHPAECVSDNLDPETDRKSWFCFNRIASRTLVFDSQTAVGGTSRLFGSLKSSGERRDSIAVEPFTCQQM